MGSSIKAMSCDDESCATGGDTARLVKESCATLCVYRYYYYYMMSTAYIIKEISRIHGRFDACNICGLKSRGRR